MRIGTAARNEVGHTGGPFVVSGYRHRAVTAAELIDRTGELHPLYRACFTHDRRSLRPWQAICRRWA